MTVHHYIASAYELPTGSFGIKETMIPLSEILDQNKKKKSETKQPLNNHMIKVYETEEDSYGIGIKKLEPGYSDILSKFNNPFVYGLLCDEHPKAIRELFKYIDQNLIEYGKIELYSCLDGDENKEKDSTLDTIINLKTLYLGRNFKLDKKEYISQLGDMFRLEDKKFVIVIK